MISACPIWQLESESSLEDMEYCASIVASGVNAIAGDVSVALVVFTKDAMEDILLTRSPDRARIVVYEKETNELIYELTPNLEALIYNINSRPVEDVDMLCHVANRTASFSHAIGFVPQSSSDMTAKLIRSLDFLKAIVYDMFGKQGIINVVGFDAVRKNKWDFVKDVSNQINVPQELNSFPHQLTSLDDSTINPRRAVVVLSLYLAEVLSLALRRLRLQSIDAVFPELDVVTNYGYDVDLLCKNREYKQTPWRHADPKGLGMRGELFQQWRECFVPVPPEAAKADASEAVKETMPDAADAVKETMPFDRTKALAMLKALEPVMASREIAGKDVPEFYSIVRTWKGELENGKKRLSDRQMAVINSFHDQHVLGNKAVGNYNSGKRKKAPVKKGKRKGNSNGK